MPREHLEAISEHEPSPEGDGVTVWNNGLEVSWSKGRGDVVITPSWYQHNYPGAQGLHPAARLLPEPHDSDTDRARNAEGWHSFDGLSRGMTWKMLNDAIRVLKRARDDAYGKPE